MRATPGQWPLIFSEGVGFRIVVWRAPPLVSGDVVDVSTAFYAPFSALMLSGGSNASSTMRIRGTDLVALAGSDGYVMVVGAGA